MAETTIRGTRYRVRDDKTVERMRAKDADWVRLRPRDLLALDVASAEWTWLSDQHVRRPSPSGASQSESERVAQQKLLRLSPAEIADLDARAVAAGLSASRYVAKILRLAASQKK